jgi:glycosyltransferase involved in cell wall biosynthesis
MEVSVLIPVFNRMDTIERAVNSVLRQSFQDFELLIVDDGSSDGSLEVVARIKDDRIRVIRHPVNRGSAEARNTGVRASRGKYLALLDSDDEWHADKLASQLQVLKQNPAEVVANVCGYFLFDEFNIKRKMMPPQPESWHRLLLMGCGLGEGTTLLVSRKAFDQIGFFDSSLPRYADWDWLLRFTRQYPMTVTPELLATVYRASRPSAAAVEKAASQFLEKHAREFQEYGNYGQRAVGKRHLEVAIYYFMEKKNHNGWLWFRKAVGQSIIQRPGMYLRVLDALLGSKIVPTLIRLRQHL